MSLKYLNLTGLSRVITNLKNWVVSQIPTKTSEITNDSGFITGTSDCVHIAGAETVTGEKTHTANFNLKKSAPIIRIRNTDVVIGSNGQQDLTASKNSVIAFKTSNDAYANAELTNYAMGTYNRFRIVSRWYTSTSAGNGIGIDLYTDANIKGLLPTEDNKFIFGSTSYLWRAVYSNAYYLGSTAFGDIVTHNASEFLTSHQSLSNYSTLANTVKSLSISGKTITVTPGSGSTYTLTTQDTVYTHPTSAGNKHIPSGGAANQYLKYSASGTAVWADLPTIPTKTSQLTNDSGFLTSHQSLAGYLPLTGGVLTGGISRKHTGVTKGTNPDSICYWSVYNCDKDGTNYKNDCLGLFETSLNTAGVVSTYIRAMKNTANNTSNASLGVAYDTANNLGYTFAPTPAANDNTTKIATTAWVQTFCGTTKGYLTSHQSLSNYVTLNGAQTITAEKTFKSDIIFNGTYNLRSNADNSYVRIQGGSGEGKGSRIILSGKTRSGLQGYAEIVATDGSNTNTFTVKPNGETLVNGNNLAATIIKGLSISGKTITYTKIDGSTGTITTQDTVYTHPTSAGNKHIPSGGSSGQILKYSSSGTAVWADVDFSRKPDTTVFSKTAWPADGTSTISCTTGCPIWIFFDVTGDNSCKISLSLSNVFVIATKMCVGSQTHKQDTTTYGTILVQSAVGRNRGTVLAWAWSTSLTLTVSHTGTFTNTPSFSVSMKQ